MMKENKTYEERTSKVNIKKKGHKNANYVLERDGMQKIANDG